MRQSVRLSLSLSGVAALALASSPYSVSADTGEVDGLDPISISLDDAVKFDWNIQGQTQGAGTPNEAGVDFFIPISVNEQSVWFVDTQFNANFGDFDGSSIVSTEVDGITLSTSTRLGYRWLNDDRSWMYGVNTGYDTRNMKTGDTDQKQYPAGNPQSPDFSQIAFGVQAISDSWDLNAYSLIPVGDKEQRINTFFNAGALETYGLDIGYNINSDLTSSLGYYYQQGDDDKVDGSGIKGRLAYELGNGLTVGANLSYDDAFDTRFSAEFKYNFGNKNAQKKEWETPIIESLSESVKHRQVRIHDGLNCTASWFANSCTRYIGPKNATPNELQYPASKHCGQWLLNMTSHDGVKACNMKY